MRHIKYIILIDFSSFIKNSNFCKIKLLVFFFFFLIVDEIFQHNDF